MPEQAGILQYPTPAESSSQLQLRESEGTVQIIWGVWPTWIYALAIAGNALLAVLQVVTVYWSARAMLMMMQMAPPPTQTTFSILRMMLAAAVAQIVTAVLYSVAALLQWYRLYRWGRVPLTLTATSTGLTLSQMGWLRPVDRFWHADQLDSIELRPMSADLFGKRTLAQLIIRRRKKFARSFRLSSTDSQLPTHIAERLAATLGCKATIH